MKVMEIRDHHSAAPKESKLRKLITIGLGLALSFGIGAYIGHTASQEIKTVERQQIHYVQEGKPSGKSRKLTTLAAMKTFSLASA